LKPLTKQHYEARQQAKEDWQKQVDAVEERKKQEGVLQKYIVVIFWKQVRNEKSM
jgi:hypothetical protein